MNDPHPQTHQRKQVQPLQHKDASNHTCSLLREAKLLTQTMPKRKIQISMLISLGGLLQQNGGDYCKPLVLLVVIAGVIVLSILPPGLTHDHPKDSLTSLLS